MPGFPIYLVIFLTLCHDFFLRPRSFGIQARRCRRALKANICGLFYTYCDIVCNTFVFSPTGFIPVRLFSSSLLALTLRLRFPPLTLPNDLDCIPFGLWPSAGIPSGLRTPPLLSVAEIARCFKSANRPSVTTF